MDDSGVTAKVKSALVESSETKAGDIKVETKTGVVQLRALSKARHRKTPRPRSRSGSRA